MVPVSVSAICHNPPQVHKTPHFPIFFCRPSTSVYYTKCKPKSKKRRRSGNEAIVLTTLFSHSILPFLSFFHLASPFLRSSLPPPSSLSPFLSPQSCLLRSEAVSKLRSQPSKVSGPPLHHYQKDGCWYLCSGTNRADAQRSMSSCVAGCGL